MRSLLKSGFRLLLPLLFSFQVGKASYSPDNIKQYTAVVHAWNDAHNNWRFSDLSRLYADKVLFYCSTITRQECISYKTGLASPSKLFLQKVISDINATDFGNGVIKCEFTKQVTIDDKKAEYPAYLVLKEFGDSLKIICESDEITDASFGFKISPEMFQPKAAEHTYSNGKETRGGSRSMYYYFGSAALILIIAFAVRRRKKKESNP